MKSLMMLLPNLTRTLTRTPALVLALALVLVLVLTGGEPAHAVMVDGHPALPFSSLDKVPVTVFPALDREALLEDDPLDDGDGPERFALPLAVSLTPDNSGTWTTVDDGTRVWRLRLDCPNALSLNLGFHRFHLPEGAVLRFFAADGQGPILRFESRDNHPSGELWTPVLLNDEVVIELEVPAAVTRGVDLEVGQVGCGYRLFGAEKSGSCNIDVVCPEGDEWRTEIPAIARYTINGYLNCTGALVNNTAQDQRPLFLSAFHCEVDPDNQHTVVMYWNYESPTCGQQGGGDLTQTTTGSTYLAGYSTSDVLLLELDENPVPLYDLSLLGWDRRDYLPEGAVCIHQPRGDEKSISFEEDPLTLATYLEEASPGNRSHLMVADWDLGTTEGGSSGSPLFDSETRLIVGTLHGGYAGCGNDEPDWYGRFHISWEGGGTADTRLRDHLDPLGTGAESLGHYGSMPTESDAGLLFQTVAPNPFQDSVEGVCHAIVETTVQVQVFDLHGYRVRDLGQRDTVVGENTITWDGLDDDGHPVPAGLYFLHVQGGGRETVAQVTRLR